MTVPPMGTYNIESQSLSYDVMSRIQRRNIIYKNKLINAGSDIGFDTRTVRFKNWVKPLYLIKIKAGCSIKKPRNKKMSNKECPISSELLSNKE